MSVCAGSLVAFVTLVLLRLIDSKQLTHFSFKILILTFTIICIGIATSAEDLQDIIVVCFPVIIIAVLEKTASIYLAKFVNNDRVSIIKLFVILSYFTGLLVAKYLL